MRFLTLLFFIFLFSSINAQFTIEGVLLVDHKPQNQARVRILSTDNYSVTDHQGRFSFQNLPKGEYALLADFAGFLSDTLKIHLTSNQKDLQFEIITASELEEVEVVSKKMSDVVAERSIKADVIALDQIQQSSMTVEHLMNSTAGIRVRSDGALGDDANIIVGGFNGKSVRFLVDGIPMDYLGSSMGITKFPTNMAHRVEIYKGVLPTEIGVDALGAAVNIVTKPPTKTSHKISYELGSYNTHRLSLNSFIRNSDKFSYGINAFANYSDNNFKVEDLPYEDEETGKTLYIEAPLFNNGYQQISGDIFINFENREWADLFKITLNSYALKRELQNDLTSRSRPFGQAHRKEHAYVVPSIQYQKNLFDRKLNLTQFLVFSSIDYALLDTVKNGYYDWLGERHEAVSGSEMGTDLSYLNEPIIRTKVNNLTYRGLFTYRFKNDQKLVLNLIENYLYRIADDLSDYDSKTFITYNRIVAGLGYHYSFFKQRLEGLSQVKYLGSQTIGEIKDMLYAGDQEYETGQGIAYNNGISLAQSFKYETKTGWLFRASTENTYRLPDQMEIFGDNVFIKPNLLLQPEKSFNVNASVAYKYPDWFTAEISGYYRNTKDMIRLKELTQFSAQFLNLDHVSGYGIELELALYPLRNLEISGNLTYNEFRFKGSNEEFALNQHFVEARVSNMPFYFGNARIAYQLDRVFSKKKKDRMNLYWSYNYVHQYYLDFIEKQYEPDGFLGIFGKSKIYTDRVIPIQHIHTAGLVYSYSLPQQKILALGLEARNIFDSKVYNNFRIQSMGRSFSVKLSFEF